MSTMRSQLTPKRAPSSVVLTVIFRDRPGKSQGEKPRENGLYRIISYFLVFEAKCNFFLKKKLKTILAVAGRCVLERFEESTSSFEVKVWGD